MKKILAFCLTLSLSLVLCLPTVSAQLLNDTAGLSSMTETVRKTANFSDMPIENIIASVIKLILGFLAVIFIILLITAGFKWMMAQGNEEQVTQSIATIRAAIIGLIVILASYAITYFVFKYAPFSGGTGTMGQAV